MRTSANALSAPIVDKKAASKMAFSMSAGLSLEETYPPGRLRSDLSQNKAVLRLTSLKLPLRAIDHWRIDLGIPLPFNPKTLSTADRSKSALHCCGPNSQVHIAHLKVPMSSGAASHAG
jgi:hypothetical protein